MPVSVFISLQGAHVQLPVMPAPHAHNPSCCPSTAAGALLPLAATLGGDTLRMPGRGVVRDCQGTSLPDLLKGTQSG